MKKLVLIREGMSCSAEYKRRRKRGWGGRGRKKTAKQDRYRDTERRRAVCMYVCVSFDVKERIRKLESQIRKDC